MKTFINCAAITGAALLCATAAFADDAETLDTVVVTASRVAETENEVLVPITVITREDIERYQSQTLSDVLRRVPGVTVSANGGNGQLTSIFLRGNSSKQTLVLINGVRVRDTSFGNQAPFQHIPVSEIERIEVVRGPRSSLYGSAGIGGVIQIFTRNGSGAPRPFAELSVGRYHHRSAAAGVSGSAGATRYSVSASGEKTRGFDVFVPSEPDNDGYESLSGSLKVGHKFSEVLDTEVSVLHSDNEVEYDGFFNSTNSIQQTVNARARFTPSENIGIDVSLGRYSQKDDNFDNGTRRTDSDSTINTVTVQSNLTVSDRLAFVAGTEYLDERLETSPTNFSNPAFNSPAANNSRHNRAAYAQGSFSAGIFDAQLNLRRDLFEGLRAKNTGSLSFGFQVSDSLQLLSSYSEAFRYASLSNSRSNPNLKPEYAKNYEIGARWQRGVFNSSVNVYHNDIQDEIIFDPNIGQFGSSVNLSALIRGVEIETGVNFENWSVGAVFNRIDSLNRDKGTELVKRPKYSAQIDVDRYFGANSLGFSITSVASSTAFGRDPAPTTGSYGLVDLRGVHQLSKNWTINAIWSNIGDKKYQTAKDYRQAGSALNLTLRYQPK